MSIDSDTRNIYCTSTTASIVERRTRIGLAIAVIGVVVIAGGLYLGNQLPVPSVKFGINLSKSNELVISDEDVVWYDIDGHTMSLTDEGARKIDALKVGVYGEPFSVRIGSEEILNGSFWSPISSVSYHGIVIQTFLGVDGNTVKLEIDYPPNSSADLDSSVDSRILEYFQRIGKLKR